MPAFASTGFERPERRRWRMETGEEPSWGEREVERAEEKGEQLGMGEKEGRELSVTVSEAPLPWKVRV